MIQYVNVSKNFGHQQVIVEANFAIHDGERVGFVGPNGAGKSTLLEMLAGNVPTDHGEVMVPGNQRLGYVRQQLNGHELVTPLIDYAENALPELNTIQAELAKVEHQLAQGEVGAEESEKLLTRMGNLQTRFEQLGGYELRSRAEAILTGLGFAPSRLNDPFNSFSGGWQIRAELSKVLVAVPDILVLDEPTNYLDVPAVEWLRDYLKSYAGTLLLVSHDRYLLNSLTNVTLEVMGGHVTRYTGNYEQYMKDREGRHENMIAQKRNVDRRREQLERFIEANRYKATKASQAQSKIKMLDKLEEVEIQSISYHAPVIRLPEPPRSGDEVVRLDEVCFSYDGRNDVIKNCSMRLERGDHAAFVGLNGMGKTTLLRLIAGKFAPRSGKVYNGHGVLPGYQSQDYAETMDPNATIYETAKTYANERSEADIRELLGSFGFHGEDIEKKVQVLSGGEKVRLGLARLLLKPLNFLLLDEPTTHLDIHAREALQAALAKYPGTIALVSHDIEFVRGVATSIYAMENHSVTKYYGDYDYYRQKLAEKEAAAAAAAAAAVPPAQKKTSAPAQKNTAGEAAGATKKSAEAPSNGALKAAERQLRRDFAKLKAPHEAAVAASEKIIAELEEEQAKLLEQLNDTANPNTDFAAINKRLAEINKLSEDETWKWDAETTELQKLEDELTQRIADLK